MSAPSILTREERQAILIEAAGGADAWTTYLAAGAALHDFAKHVPGALGLNVADIYKTMTVRLDAALRQAEASGLEAAQ